MPITVDTIRWMIRTDLPAVMAIEHQSDYANWTEEEFVSCLRQRNCIGMVAEDSTQKDYQIYGFVIYELHNDELRILNIAVDKEYRRQGVGRAIIEKMKKRLTQKRKRISLIVSERNLGAHLFFKSMGFRAIDIIDDYYDDNNDDAYYMTYEHSNIIVQEL